MLLQIITRLTGADQVEHLDGLREAGVRAISNVIHFLDKHVAPDVQREHAWKQNKAAEDPQPECDFPRLDSKKGPRGDLERVEGQER